MIGQLGRTSRNRAGQKQLLEVVEERRVFLRQERDCGTVLAGATRTTDAMSVILNRLGHVVVDDERDVLDVDTATGHVSSDEDVLSAGFEIGQGELTLLLSLATVQSTSIVLNKEKES